MEKALTYCLIICGLLVADVVAGPYANSSNDASNPFDPGVPGFTGPDGAGVVSAANQVNPQFVGWATHAVSYQPANHVDPEWQNPLFGLGPVTGDQFDIVSLGELDTNDLAHGPSPGEITLGFAQPIANGPGPDFAVFENGFEVSPGAFFSELAYVEVSTDGTNFVRFPSASLTPNPVPFAPGTLDPTDVYNLAGKHANSGLATSWGTPFDLATLPAGASNIVDLQCIRYVRLIDIPGSGDFSDHQANPIYDLWPSEGSGGFDLEAIGVIHARTEIALQGTSLSVTTTPNRQYHLEMTSELTPPAWTDIGAPFMGNGQDHQMSLPLPAQEQPAYFRIRVEQVSE